MEPGGLLDILTGILQGVLLVYWGWRLAIGVRARLTSLGMYIILLFGFLLISLPRTYGIGWLEDLLVVIRFTLFTIAAVLSALDWRIYLKLTKEQREERKKT